jgi:hypothetical protein
MADDIVRALLRLAREMNPATPAEWEGLEFRFKQDWGGSRYYIQKAPTAPKQRRLADALAAGVPMQRAFELAGVSRRWGYEILARPWVRR